VNSPAPPPIAVTPTADLLRMIGEAVRREVLAVAVEVSPPAAAPAAAPAPEPPKALLTAAEVAAMVTLSKRTIRRAILSGSFPAAVTIGARAIRWHRYDVELWLSQRKDAK